MQKEIVEQLWDKMARRAGWGTVSDGRALLSQLRSGLPGYSGGMGEAGQSKKKGAMWRLVAEDVALPGSNNVLVEPGTHSPTVRAFLDDPGRHRLLDPARVDWDAYQAVKPYNDPG